MKVRRAMSRTKAGRCGGFSILEMMVVAAVMALILSVLLGVTSGASSLWRRSSQKMRLFQEARASYEQFVDTLSQATLNTYWDYDDPGTPTRYQRQSELHFASGPTSDTYFSGVFGSRKILSGCAFFQWPGGYNTSPDTIGLPLQMNPCGFFVEFDDGTGEQPDFLKSTLGPRWRPRLKRWMAPSEKNLIFEFTSANPAYNALDWVRMPTGTSDVRSLGENIAGLWLVPLSTDANGLSVTLSPDYVYNTRLPAATDVRRHQLPPLVRCIMLAIAEDTAARLATKHGSTLPPEYAEMTAGLFLSTSSSTPDKDLAELRRRLDAKGFAYKVFDSTVMVRAAKWSDS